MKVQNNVNYNSNPAFGTRMILTGPRELKTMFANVLEGGYTVLGKKDMVEVCHGNPPFVAPTYVAMETDARLLQEKFNANTGGGSFAFTKGYDNILKGFFKEADKVDLTKPMQYILSGSAVVRERLASVFKAFEIHGARVKIVHDLPSLNTSYVMVGETAKAFVEKSKKLAFEREIVEPAIDMELVHSPHFINDATVINVTE